jgi:hypothetical protein
MHRARSASRVASSHGVARRRAGSARDASVACPDESRHRLATAPAAARSRKLPGIAAGTNRVRYAASTWRGRRFRVKRFAGADG